VAKCTLRIIIEDESELDECTKYKLSTVAFFVWPSANARMGIKKLGDFCDSYFLKFATNAPLQGGLTALSTAALHGNLEVLLPSFHVPLCKNGPPLIQMVILYRL